MKVTNNSNRNIGLADHFLPAGATVEVADWPKHAENVVIKAWLAAGVISIGATATKITLPPVVTKGEEGEEDEKDALITMLAQHGIRKDRRSSVESLREALEQATAPDSGESDEG